MIEIYLSGPAVADLEAISEQALASQPSLAQALIQHVQNSITQLAAQYTPRLAAKPSLEEIGRILSGRFAVHYEIKDKRLAISRILRRHVPLSELS